MASCRLNRPAGDKYLFSASASDYSAEIDVWNLEEARQNLPDDLLLSVDAPSYQGPGIFPPHLLVLLVILGVPWALVSSSLLARRTHQAIPSYLFWNSGIFGAGMLLLGSYFLLTLIDCPRFTWWYLLIYGFFIYWVVAGGTQLLYGSLKAKQARIFGLEPSRPLPRPKPWITPFVAFGAISIICSVVLLIVGPLVAGRWESGKNRLQFLFLAGPILGLLAANWLWWMRRRKKECRGIGPT